MSLAHQTWGGVPGYRPDVIFHQGVTFDLLHAEIHDGDVKFWLYREVVVDDRCNLVPGTQTLTVFND